MFCVVLPGVWILKISCLCIQQYWSRKDIPHQYISVEVMALRMQQSKVGQQNAAHIAAPYVAKPDAKDPLIYNRTALSRKSL